MAAAEKNPTAKQIWDTLSRINVNEHTEEKGGLTYLSWAWAWTMMMDNYPNLTVTWHGTKDKDGVMRDITTYPGGTASVTCDVTIGDVRRAMWLPVMDYRNKAIIDPDSRAISDAKQRCLTKCFGILGLGCYIYAGSDLPRDPAVEAPPKKAPKPKRSAPSIVSSASTATNPTELAKEEKIIDGWVTDLKKTVTDLHKRGWTPADDLAKKQITDAIKNRNGEALVKLRKEILILADSALALHNAEEEKNNG